MLVLESRNVHQALQRGMEWIGDNGVPRESRAGNVLVAPTPVTSVYRAPSERVLFWRNRDANPWFHFMEGLWMLAGREDVAWLSQFSSNIAQFSDNGRTFHGAYGYRWRQSFQVDQLPVIADRLRQNPEDRRAVLGIWSPSIDLERVGKDVPCNLAVHFQVNHDMKLDMTVFNRSNDLIWGCYGANAVHFSMLHEVMSSCIGYQVGRYYQVSNNFHAYVDTMTKHEAVVFEDYPDPYELGVIEPYPMVNVDPEIWFQDLCIFMDEGPIIGFRDPFFRRVVTPMFHSWAAWKNKSDPKRIDNALEIISQCAATDWKKACTEWLERRRKN